MDKHHYLSAVQEELETLQEVLGKMMERLGKRQDMTKQEEIREEIWQVLRGSGLHIAEADDVLETIWNILNSQGTVIKVKCPNCEWSQFKDGERVGMTPCYSCNSAGYIVEPLIEETTDGR